MQIDKMKNEFMVILNLENENQFGEYEFMNKLAQSDNASQNSFTRKAHATYIKTSPEGLIWYSS